MNTPTHLVAIDPGLSQLGWAAFDTTGLNKHPQDAAIAGRLLARGTVRTDAQEDMLVRLVRLYHGVLEALAANALHSSHTLIVIEKPARPGGYMGRASGKFAAMAGGMASLHMAIGALVGGLVQVGYTVEFRAPNTRSKSARWERANVLLGAIRGSTNKETRDAIWLGVQVLLDGRRVWGQRVLTLPE